MLRRVERDPYILLEPMKVVLMKNKVSAILHQEKMQGHLVRRKPKNNVQIYILVLQLTNFTWMH